jgi:CRP-like cAMP-binding protein
MSVRPEVSLKIIEVLSERLDLYGSRMAHIALKEVTARLANLILSLVESQEIASGEVRKVPTRYTHEQLHVGRCAARGRNQGFGRALESRSRPETRQQHICVKDMEALERIAER